MSALSVPPDSLWPPVNSSEQFELDCPASIHSFDLLDVISVDSGGRCATLLEQLRHAQQTHNRAVCDMLDELVERMSPSSRLKGDTCEPCHPHKSPVITSTAPRFSAGDAVDIGEADDLARRTTSAQGSSSSHASNIGEEEELGLSIMALPADWPSCLTKRWAGDYDQDRLMHYVRSKWGQLAATDSSAAGTQSFGMDGKRWLIMDPLSPWQLAYRLLCLACVMYELVWVPVVIAWDVTLSGALLYTAMFTCAVWTIEVPITFLTAVMRHEEVISDPRVIARRYASTWLLPDLLLVVSGWASVIVEAFDASGGNSANIGVLRVVRITRLTRAFTALRALKVAKVIDKFSDGAFWKVGVVTARVSYPAIVLVYLMHWIGCLWFFIGRDGYSDTGLRWLDIRVHGIDVKDSPMQFQYLTSFNYASQWLTLVSNPTGVNSCERFFGACILLLGLGAGTFLISSLSAALVEAQLSRKEKNDKMNQMRQYLLQNNVHWRLSTLVLTHLDDKLETKKRLRDDEVVGLWMLPDGLRQDLKLEICRPGLTMHPLFRLWLSLDAVTVAQRFCAECISFRSLSRDDDLFVDCVTAVGSYLCLGGSLEYRCGHLNNTKTVSHGDWLAEAAMWCHWIHVGTATATEDSNILCVQLVATDGSKPKSLDEMIPASATLLQLTQEYCALFHHCVQTARPPLASWPDDVHVPCADWSELVFSMSEASQKTIGRIAMQEHSGWHAKLWDEVQQGKSVVILNKSGRLERFTSVVALKIHKEGKTLTQLAKENGQGEIVPDCELPGGKLRRGETPSEAMSRVLREKLLPLLDSVTFLSVEQEIVSRSSKQFGVFSKYSRNVFHCNLNDAADLQPFVQAIRTAGASSGQRAMHARAHFAMAGPVMSGLFRSSGARNDFDVPEKFLVSLLNSEALCFRGNGKKTLYAWLDDAQLKACDGPHGGEVLAQWIQAVLINTQGSLNQDFAVDVD